VGVKLDTSQQDQSADCIWEPNVTWRQVFAWPQSYQLDRLVQRTAQTGTAVRAWSTGGCGGRQEVHADIWYGNLLETVPWKTEKETVANINKPGIMYTVEYTNIPEAFFMQYQGRWRQQRVNGIKATMWSKVIVITIWLKTWQADSLAHKALTLLRWIELA
jgi:hypothetical protein